MTRDTAPAAAALLRAYDDELRGEAELSAERTHRIGPLFLSIHPDRGFLSYRDLDGTTGQRLHTLIEAAIAFYRDQTTVPFFEWKTRAHDAPADLPQRLLGHGFVPEEAESVMVGEIAALPSDVPSPGGVTVRRVDPGDLGTFTHAHHLQGHVFGQRHSSPEHEARRCAESDGRRQLWVAEAAAEGERGEPWGAVVCAGVIDIVPGTRFAGVWGGATHERWRHRGIYRALTAARAQAAAAQGARYLQSDSTGFSRPILERSGLVRVTTTTPYLWTR